jgi:hypothetical protein
MDAIRQTLAERIAELERQNAKIARLREALGLMMDWARQLPSEYLDSDPDVRHQFREDMAIADATYRGDK